MPASLRTVMSAWWVMNAAISWVMSSPVCSSSVAEYADMNKWVR